MKNSIFNASMNSDLKEAASINSEMSYSLNREGEMRKMTDGIFCINDVFSNNTRWDYQKSVPTGYYQLDNALGGLERGHLYLLGGAQGMGTTAFALCLSEKIAVDGKGCVIYVTNQMSSTGISKRMVKSIARVSFDKDTPSDEEAEEIRLTIERLSRSEIYVINGMYRSLEEITDVVMMSDLKTKIDMIVIDGLEGICKGEELWNDVLVGCKRLAEMCDCAVFVTAECSESYGTCADTFRPTIDSFGIPVITKYVDCIMTLYQEDYYDEDASMKGVAEIDILRSKKCNPQRIKMVSLREYGRFIGIDPVEYVWSDEQKNED